MLDPAAGLARYRGDPVGYARDVLRVTLWPRQQEILRALHEPPYRVFVRSGHKIGKSFLCAVLINYHFDCYDPGACVTTAPTYENVVDVLWAQVRLQRMRAGLPDHFIGPAAPEMRTSPDHFAKGISTNRPEAFHGRHFDNMLFVFDEATGVAREYWTVVKTMFKPQPGCGWIVILNPTDTSSQAYQEEQSGEWKVFSLSALDHPNIPAELAGEPPPIPGAVSLDMVHGWVRDWCTPVTAEERLATDLEWPPGSGKWVRPGPEFECRGLGLWPSQGTYSVWSDALWAAIEGVTYQVPILGIPEIGCDVARFGDDKTAIHVRWGHTSFHHEEASGWRTTQTTGRLIELAREYADLANGWRRQAGGNRPEITAQQVRIKVDDTGVGAAVTDSLSEQGFSVWPVNAGERANDPTRYPNKRSELWFTTARRAAAGCLGLGRLDPATRAMLRAQAMAPSWWLDSAGRRVVEPKDDTKAKLGRSPDSLDSMNLAFYEVGGDTPTVLDLPHRSKVRPGGAEEGEPRRKRKLFGR